MTTITTRTIRTMTPVLTAQASQRSVRSADRSVEGVVSVVEPDVPRDRADDRREHAEPGRQVLQRRGPGLPRDDPRALDAPRSDRAVAQQPLHQARVHDRVPDLRVGRLDAELLVERLGLELDVLAAEQLVQLGAQP